VREALQTLRDNIRDEKGSVQRMGVHDNNDTRDAIAALLENEAALSANGGDAGWHGKPSQPGRYEVRGFNDDGTVGFVSVALADGDLVCNLHDRSTADVSEYSYLLDDIDESFEWRTLYTHPAPPSVAVPENDLRDRVLNLLCALGHQGVDMGEGQLYDVGEWGIKEAQELHTLLTAAPQPDHSPDGGEVVQGDLTETAIKSGPAYRALYAEKQHLLNLLKEPAADGGEVEPAFWITKNDFERASNKTNLLCSVTVRGEWDGLVPLYTHPAESREEIQAQALETYADQLDAVFERAQEARAVNCPAWHSGQFAKDARKQAARLRASQQEGGE